MNLPGKGAVQQRQTFGFRDGLILDQAHIIRVIGKQFANLAKLRKKRIFLLFILGQRVKGAAVCATQFRHDASPTFLMNSL